MMNWWGVESHPSDELIGWRDPNRRDFHQLAGDVQDAWNKIVAAGLERELKLLIRQARENERDDAADSAAGEDL